MAIYDTDVLVKGFASYNDDYTENLFYESNGEVFKAENIKLPNSSFWQHGKPWIKVTKPETWEFIGNYNLTEK